jgi:hypothetical protein
LKLPLHLDCLKIATLDELALAAVIIALGVFGRLARGSKDTR